MSSDPEMKFKGFGGEDFVAAFLASQDFGPLERPLGVHGNHGVGCQSGFAGKAGTTNFAETNFDHIFQLLTPQFDELSQSE